MKLFTVGPVEMYPETLEASSLQLPYFRTREFSEIMLEMEAMLLKLADAPKGSRGIFLTASGTAAMEASVMNCLTAEDHAMVVNGGSFGHRFVQIVQRHGVPYTEVELPYGQTLTMEMLEHHYQRGMTALIVNLHETSIGQLYDLEMLHRFCRTHDLLFIVDAISAFLADEISMQRCGVDVLIMSSQKAFALAPGISMVLLSPRGLAKAREHQSPSCMYFDFQDYLKNGERGQPPYTPAVGILLTLHKRLKQIDAQGIECTRKEIADIAHYFRERIKQLPIQIPSYPLSNALTPLYFPEGGAKQLYEKLYAQGFNLTPCGGALADKLLRVGHIGHLTCADVDLLIDAIKGIYE